MKNVYLFIFFKKLLYPFGEYGNKTALYCIFEWLESRYILPNKHLQVWKSSKLVGLILIF